jgi:hypothetical protein
MASATKEKKTVVWSPQPKQWKFITCPIEDVFFGGARGGAKSDGILGDIASHVSQYPEHARALLVRRSYPELEELIERSKQIFPYVSTGGIFNNTEKTWRWSYGGHQGALLRMRHLQDAKTAALQQGFSYTYVGVDELTNFPSLTPIDMLRATLRSGAGVPTYFRATGNPGGPGHLAVKSRYIDPSPPMKPFMAKEKVGNVEVEVNRIFIPSTLDDNLVLQHNDPNYWQRVVLSAGGNEALLKAWRYGEWDIADGAAFMDVWDPHTHILKPFDPPESWTFTRSYDHGSSAPFSVGFWAISNGEESKDGHWFSPGTAIRIGELYGWDGTKPNEGLRLSYSELGRRIREKEEQICDLYKIRSIEPGPADNQIFDVTDGKTIEDGMGVTWTRSSKGPGSRATGLVNVRSRLYNSIHEKDLPGLYVFDTCRDGFIRTVPVLPLKPGNADDVDTNAEDHAYDEVRYLLSSFEPTTVTTVNTLGF